MQPGLPQSVLRVQVLTLLTVCNVPCACRHPALPAEQQLCCSPDMVYCSNQASVLILRSKCDLTFVCLGSISSGAQWHQLPGSAMLPRWQMQDCTAAILVTARSICTSTAQQVHQVSCARWLVAARACAMVGLATIFVLPCMGTARFQLSTAGATQARSLHCLDLRRE